MTTGATARFVQAGVAIAMLAAAWPAAAQVQVPLGAERYEVTITPPPRPGSAAALKPRAPGTDRKAPEKTPDAAMAAPASAAREAAPAGQPLAGASGAATAANGSVAGGANPPPKPGASSPAAPGNGGPAAGGAAEAPVTAPDNATSKAGASSGTAGGKPGSALNDGSGKPGAAIATGARSAAVAAPTPAAAANPAAPKPAEATPGKSAPAAAAGPARSLQVGAFRQRKSATALRQELAGFPDVQVSEVSSGGEPLFRVTVGRLPKGKALDDLKRRLGAAGHPVFEIAAPASPGAATR